MDIVFRHIVRAIIVDEGKILIARMKGAHSFLPGGGVDRGEGAREALRRELYEELGALCTIGRFLGVAETHRVDEHGVMQHEISHLFAASSDQLKSHFTPKSHENHLEFYWIELTTESIKQHGVLPPVLQEHLVDLMANKEAAWITTFPE